MIKAIIFDRDGVILNSESNNLNSAIKAFKKLKINISPKEKELIIGRHPDDYTPDFLNKYNFSYNEFRKIQKKEYFDNFDSIPLFKKTITLIKELSKQEIKLALTTSSGRESTLRLLKRANLKNVFDEIVTSEDYKNRKPNPEPYLLTAKRLGLKPKECLVIEDSKVGLDSAKSAKMKCIVIPNDFTKNQDFSNADLIIQSAKEINLGKLNKLF